MLVADEWFTKNYPGYSSIRISVHPQNRATKAAVAGASFALTYEKLNALISDARAILSHLCESKLRDEDLIAECDSLLEQSNIRFDKLADNYLCAFEELE